MTSSSVVMRGSVPCCEHASPGRLRTVLEQGEIPPGHPQGEMTGILGKLFWKAVRWRASLPEAEGRSFVKRTSAAAGFLWGWSCGEGAWDVAPDLWTLGLLWRSPWPGALGRGAGHKPHAGGARILLPFTHVLPGCWFQGKMVK